MDTNGTVCALKFSFAGVSRTVSRLGAGSAEIGHVINSIAEQTILCARFDKDHPFMEYPCSDTRSRRRCVFAAFRKMKGKLCMSRKASSHSKIRTIKVTCNRCKQIVEGIRGEEFTAGFYEMTKWDEYKRENEQYVCNSCMFADPKYVERYGSCF